MMMQRDPINTVVEEMVDGGELTFEAWEEIRHKIEEQVDQDDIEAEEHNGEIFVPKI